MQLRLTHACQFSLWRWTSLVHHLRVQHLNNAMNINDEGRSNAAYWHERAMKAEARLAEAERHLRNMYAMVHGKVPPDHPFTLSNVSDFLRLNPADESTASSASDALP